MKFLMLNQDIKKDFSYVCSVLLIQPGDGDDDAVEKWNDIVSSLFQ